ncbi:hypothetical protein [Amycolatopsis regifaucium]|uniref:Uncharacterized protein n=1 Tax=Amycolatopsis regifaucium TaxID=546365 RepID=A0A154MEK4_9PSEU|nr:hypothetical protein [Amycolatopsis regifaucium]KZB82886.1 hypothetical protein AVL48_37175 [Amycolatopsis regifaucium]OKA03366.1 hypothetical protein ATP06_0236795 [Amycolatopsis regifaucium]SFJ67416.1 hypothetical protein SAMN04489731_1304 [Amycolatopsis regifaucium]
MSQYLAKAADLIAKAAVNNEHHNGPTALWPKPEPYRDNAIRLADAYAALAAIEHGVLPAALVQRVLDAIPTDVNHSC